MHDDRAHAYMLEEHDVGCEGRLKRRVGHGVAAVFDDDGLAQQALHIGQRLHQDLRFIDELLHRLRSVSRRAPRKSWRIAPEH